jgi:hypothetical protein
MPLNYFFLALLAGCCGYAWLCGGAPERIGAAIFATGTLLTIAAASAPPVRFSDVEIGIFAADFLTFAAFLILALRAERFWPLWMSGLLGVGLVAHLAKSISPEVVPWAYAVVLSVWSYPMLFLLVLGTWSHRKRLAKHGADRSWTSSSARSGRRKPPPGPPA